MKKILNQKTLLLILILVIGAFFRFYQVGDSPQGLWIDEASIGYNAFSILKTGKDEFGMAFPVMFRSFTTFQSPVYTYLSIPFIAFFGLSPFSVRILSAVLGLLTLPVLFLLLTKLSPPKYSGSLPLLATFLLAISPWHIQYSRTAYETNASLFFLLLGLLFFYYGLKKTWWLVLSSLILVLSALAYRAEFVIVPLLLLFLGLANLKNLSQNFKTKLLPYAISVIVGLVILFPTLSILKTPGFQARSTSLNIFSNQLGQPWGYLSTPRFNNLVNNRLFLSVQEFASLYSTYFSPRYLFFLGDAGPRKPFPDFGTFYLWQFPFYLAGLYFLIKNKDLGQLRFFTLAFLLISPIPAALTREPYSTIRALAMVIPLIIVISIGLIDSLNAVKNFKLINSLLPGLVLIITLFSIGKLFISIFYFNDYFNAIDWDRSWKIAIQKISDLNPSLPIVIDNSHGHPYIYYLLYTQYDPLTYQKNNFEVKNQDYYTDMKRNPTKYLGRVTVKNLQWGIDTDNAEQYIIADSLAISDDQAKLHPNLQKVLEINLPNGDPSLNIYKTSPIKPKP